MAQSIRLKRRVGGAAGAPATLAAGEPAYNDNDDTLHIGNGTTVRTLVSAARQVEILGAQTVTGAKTFSPSSFLLTGGANGNLLETDGAGNISWVAPPSGAVSVSDPLDGDGTAGDPLTVTPATTAQIATGTDDVFPVTSAGLRNQLGAAASTLTTTAQTVVPAINELVAKITTLQGAILLVGTWDAASDDITPGLGSPAAAGALPAASADNQGWYLIVDNAGTGGGGEAGTGPFALGDWLLSTGTEWLHFEMNLGTIAAANVAVTTITGLTATNVQAALEEIHASALTEIFVDGTSITGDGLAAATELTVATVDGGTF